VENFFAFGLTVEEVTALSRRGYRSLDFIARNPSLAAAIALIDSDFFCIGDALRYRQIADVLRYHDHYMVCADFASYTAAMTEAAELYRDQRAWHRQAVFNIAGASRFSSDATIRAYANEIWNLRPVKAELR
jgi:starch phosphorylase